MNIRNGMNIEFDVRIEVEEPEDRDSWSFESLSEAIAACFEREAAYLRENPGRLPRCAVAGGVSGFAAGLAVYNWENKQKSKETT
jgi:hypothetical protein